MDARGSAAARQRTYLREVPMGHADLSYAIAAAVALPAAGAAGGWLRLWDGRFAA